MPDLDVALPGAGGEHGGQHGVEGGAHAGLRVPVQCAGAAGGAEAVHQDPAVGTARQQQVTIRGALAAHRVAFHLQRMNNQLSDSAAQCTRPHGPSHGGAAGAWSRRLSSCREPGVPVPRPVSPGGSRGSREHSSSTGTGSGSLVPVPLGRPAGKRGRWKGAPSPRSM